MSGWGWGQSERIIRLNYINLHADWLHCSYLFGGFLQGGSCGIFTDVAVLLPELALSASFSFVLALLLRKCWF